MGSYSALSHFSHSTITGAGSSCSVLFVFFFPTSSLDCKPRKGRDHVYLVYGTDLRFSWYTTVQNPASYFSTLLYHQLYRIIHNRLNFIMSLQHMVVALEWLYHGHLILLFITWRLEKVYKPEVHMRIAVTGFIWTWDWPDPGPWDTNRLSVQMKQLQLQRWGLGTSQCWLLIMQFRFR